MDIIKTDIGKRTLQTIILIFPLIIVFKSTAINTSLLTLSLVSLFLIIKDKDYSFFSNYFIIIILFFISFVFINSLINFKNIETVIKSFGNFRFIFLTFATVFILNNISKKNYLLFIFLNCTLIVFINFDILYQFTFNKNILNFPPGMCGENFTNCTRFSGIFGDELVAGGFISQIGLLFFFMAINEIPKKNNFQKYIAYLYLLLLFVTILLTGERNALLIFIICLFIFCIFYKKATLLLLSLPIIGVIFFILALNSNAVKERYLNILNSTSLKSQSSILKKISTTPWSYHYQTAFEMFLDKPLLGHGYKNFRVKCKETKMDKKTVNQPLKYKRYRGCSSHPHNYMLEMLSENGIIGFMFYLIILMIIFLNVFKLRKYSKDKNQLLLIGIGSLLIAILFPFKPSGSFLTTFNASILFYLLGFFTYYKSQIKQDQ